MNKIRFSMHEVVVIQVGTTNTLTEVKYCGSYLDLRRVLHHVFQAPGLLTYIKPDSAFDIVNQKPMIKLAAPERVQQ